MIHNLSTKNWRCVKISFKVWFCVTKMPVMSITKSRILHSVDEQTQNSANIKQNELLRKSFHENPEILKNTGAFHILQMLDDKISQIRFLRRQSANKMRFFRQNFLFL